MNSRADGNLKQRKKNLNGLIEILAFTTINMSRAASEGKTEENTFRVERIFDPEVF